MRIISASNFGPPEVLRVEERPRPHPKADEVIVEVKAAGINLMDTYLRRGMTPPTSVPTVFGVDGAGIEVAVGAQSQRGGGDRMRPTPLAGRFATGTG